MAVRVNPIGVESIFLSIATQITSGPAIIQTFGESVITGGSGFGRDSA